MDRVHNKTKGLTQRGRKAVERKECFVVWLKSVERWGGVSRLLGSSRATALLLGVPVTVIKLVLMLIILSDWFIASLKGGLQKGFVRGANETQEGRVDRRSSKLLPKWQFDRFSRLRCSALQQAPKPFIARCSVRIVRAVHVSRKRACPCWSFFCCSWITSSQLSVYVPTARPRPDNDHPRILNSLRRKIEKLRVKTLQSYILLLVYEENSTLDVWRIEYELRV